MSNRKRQRNAKKREQIEIGNMSPLLAYKKGRDFGLWGAWIIMFIHLSDKGYTQSQLQEIYDGVNNTAECIRKGYCTLDDWDKVLQEEYDIHVGKVV